jgi:hypothetical protein
MMYSLIAGGVVCCRCNHAAPSSQSPHVQAATAHPSKPSMAKRGSWRCKQMQTPDHLCKVQKDSLTKSRG